MKCVVITAKNEVLKKEIGHPVYKTAGELVGGTIRTVHTTQLPPPMVIICNSAADELGLRMNGIASGLHGFTEHYEPILGDVVVMALGMSRGAHCLFGLTDEQIEKVQEICASIVAKYRDGAEVSHE